MRISMVSEHASPLAALGGVDVGGQNLHVAELSAALCRRGHEVTVYTRRDDPFLDERVRAPAGYDVVHVPAGPAVPLPKDDLLPHMAEFGRHLARFWASDRPDVVHAHFWMSGLAALAAAEEVDVPVVQTFHALGVVIRRYQGAADTSPVERIDLERRIGEEATRVAATCSDEVFELARMDIPRIPDVRRSRRRRPATFPPRRPARPQVRHRLVTVGRLVPRKGFEVAIDALGMLEDTELVIAGGPAPSELGDDKEAQRLLDHADVAGVADRVKMTGQISRDDMPALLRSADAVLCTPWYEPFGIVPLEAMACAVPVVASAVGVLIDTVVDGVTGELVPPREPVALAEAVRRVLADRATRDAYGLAGCQRARSRYSWNRIAADILRVYTKALTSRSERATKEAAL